jgi:hypothetical protein
MSRRAHRVMHRPALAQINGANGANGANGGTSALLQKRTPAPPEQVRDVVNSSGEPLDTSTRSHMEPRFGHDFSNVRVHTDARAAESANALNAEAYTLGQHVVFGDGNYRPASSDGRQLIAHELTHVVQQQSTPAPAGASGMVQRQPKPAPPAKAPAKPKGKEPPPKVYPVKNCPLPEDFKDAQQAGSQMMCVGVGNEVFEQNPSCDLTEGHFKLINAAKEKARKRVQKAESRMHWLGGPEYAQKLAKMTFKGEAPDSQMIKNTLATMLKLLTGDAIKFRGATCADPLCESKGQHAVAYESGRTEPVAFCPRSFLEFYLPKMERTVIHEAVHLAGIDIDPNIDEVYCDGKQCGEQCQDATSADAWALFIDCLGGALLKAKPQYEPRTSFDQKTGQGVESEFGK